jgi:hypothetical protein
MRDWNLLVGYGRLLVKLHPGRNGCANDGNQGEEKLAHPDAMDLVLPVQKNFLHRTPPCGGSPLSSLWKEPGNAVYSILLVLTSELFARLPRWRDQQMPEHE